MRGFIAYGKQVKDAAGEHFADAASEVAAKLIVAALNFRNHQPVVNEGTVICSRCQSALPEDGDQPCIAKPARCRDTPDLFGDDDMPHTGTEPRPCHCGLPAKIVIDDEPLCEQHGNASIKGGDYAKRKRAASQGRGAPALSAVPAG